MKQGKAHTHKQAMFFRELLGGKLDAPAILAACRIRPQTLVKWEQDAAFVAYWEDCLKVVKRMARTAAAVAMCADARRAGACAVAPATQPVARVVAAEPFPDVEESDPTGAGVGVGRGRETGSKRRVEREHAPALSERDRILALNGEASAQAYDCLMQSRRARAAAAATAGAGAMATGDGARGDAGATSVATVPEPTLLAARVVPLATPADDARATVAGSEAP